MRLQQCPICGTGFDGPVFVSELETMITSLCGLLQGRTEVYQCGHCGHLSTPPLENLAEYYRTDYQILVASEDEDQLYEVKEGRKTYRFDHQLETLCERLAIPQGARVLDYGCAKGATIRRLAERRPDIQPHLFDVSDMYLPFWQRFCRQDQWATHVLPDAWHGHFDVVFSFYALEHIADPMPVLSQMRSLLREDGQMYLIVPNVFSNHGDFLVADHVQHFSASSLRYALERCGLEDVWIDDQVHRGAFVAGGRRGAERDAEPAIDASEVAAAVNQVRQIGEHWSRFPQSVREFERAHEKLRQVAVYGAGFYGTLISACLTKPERVSCFIDQNPFRWRQPHLGRPVVPPDQLPEAVDGIYVGLNPSLARAEIAKIEGWKSRDLEHFFI